MKTKLYIKIFLLIILVLTGVQVVVSNSLSTTGIEVSKLEKQIKTMQEENSLLRENLLLSTSLTNIAGVSKEMGFGKKSGDIHVPVSLPLASTR